MDTLSTFLDDTFLNPVELQVLVEASWLTFPGHVLALFSETVQVEQLGDDDQHVQDLGHDDVLIQARRIEHDQSKTVQQIRNLEMKISMFNFN